MHTRRRSYKTYTARLYNVKPSTRSTPHARLREARSRRARRQPQQPQRPSRPALGRRLGRAAGQRGPRRQLSQCRVVPTVLETTVGACGLPDVNAAAASQTDHGGGRQHGWDGARHLIQARCAHSVASAGQSGHQQQPERARARPGESSGGSARCAKKKRTAWRKRARAVVQTTRTLGLRPNKMLSVLMRINTFHVTTLFTDGGSRIVPEKFTSASAETRMQVR